MTIEAYTGRIVSCSNQTISDVSGQISGSSVTGFSSQGTGFITGGGGGGSIKTQIYNLEKGMIRLPNGREYPFQFKADPMFNVGNVATLVYERKRLVVVKNHSNGREWHETRPTELFVLLCMLGIIVLGLLWLYSGGVWIFGDQRTIDAFYYDFSIGPLFVLALSTVAIYVTYRILKSFIKARSESWWRVINGVLDKEVAKHRDMIDATPPS